MRAKYLTALALATGLSLTACQGGGGDSDASKGGSGDGASASSSSSSEKSGGSSASDQGAATTGDDSTATEAAQGSGSGNGSGNGQVTTGPCKTADLGFSTSHRMAEGTLMVSLKNNGGDSCSLKGFPGVDLRSQDASGPLSAKRSKLAAPAVAVKPGESTRFTLHYPSNDSGGSGVYVSAIVVTPPNETHSKALSADLRLPVGADAGDQVRVDPVGTGKQ
ncbi:DUF4232 domain-containing protein [Streptomyces sp. NPDC048436]|uniref:DUF4232 domain-containing protein n=1 Tax=Streptomyces sp. NPDC048436 TaxID=3365550 RepID=UPI003712EF94